MDLRDGLSIAEGNSPWLALPVRRLLAVTLDHALSDVKFESISVGTMSLGKLVVDKRRLDRVLRTELRCFFAISNGSSVSWWSTLDRSSPVRSIVSSLLLVAVRDAASGQADERTFRWEFSSGEWCNKLGLANPFDPCV